MPTVLKNASTLMFEFATSHTPSQNRQLEELQKRVDLTLHTHIVNRDVQYLQFSFRYYT